MNNVTDQTVTDKYALFCGDSAEVLPQIPDESVGLSIHSPPFATEIGGCLYHYSSSERDLSNCKDYAEFFVHYEFIVRELARATMPGRFAAVHCMDIPKDGANICGYLDFPGDIIKLYEKCGFEYTPRIIVWNEPLMIRNRTMTKALAHRQICDDSSLVNVAAADYLIPFRKKGENKTPIAHPTGLMRYAGACSVPAELLKYRGWKGDQKQNLYSHWIWRRYASAIWDDIRGKTGNREADQGAVLAFQEARDADDERHLHPLQLDIIERAVTLWSNPGEVVLSPFAGVGSEVYGAVVNGRKGVGIELKPAYYRQAVKNLADAEVRKDDADGEQLDMFTSAYEPDDTSSDDAIF
jgi:DNA modification methylase